MSQPVALDQYYTETSVAQRCKTILDDLLEDIVVEEYVEPSAGEGSFYHLLPADRRFGLDIAPAHASIKTADFLTWSPDSAVAPCSRVIIGNPPFGKRGITALEFMLRSCEMADTVAMILPMSFAKYDKHRRLPPEMRLISETTLEPESFHLPDGKSYSVNTVFQIWTRHSAILPAANSRILAPPPTTHPDFLMWQYNNTRQAERYFDEAFEFAVPCQGWQDYTRKVPRSRASECERQKQWMLISPLTGKARDILANRLDYHDLAHRQITSVPGFRKHDLVAAYDAKAATFS